MARIGPRTAWLVSAALGAVVRLLFLTVRIQDCPRSAAWRRGQIPHRGVYPLWHSHQLGGIWHYRRQGVVTIASAHRDAEYPARFAESLGYIVVRGSSTRGGTRAFLELLGHARAGKAIAITPDGPRGPRHVVKPGAIHLAKDANVPVVPIAIGYSSCWTMKSWDGFRIPKPFCRGYVLWGDPVTVRKNASNEEIEAARLNIERQMIRLEEQADALAARG